MSAKQPRKPKAFNVKPEWRLLAAEIAKGSSGGPLQKDLMKCLNQFLAEDQQQKVQLAALRKMANIVGKAADDMDPTTREIIGTCILPIVMEIHFAVSAPSESSFRAAIFTLICKIDELETRSTSTPTISANVTADTKDGGPQTVREHLQAGYDRLLDFTQGESGEVDKVTYLGAVLLTMLDKPLGKSVVQAHLLATFQVLLRLLSRTSTVLTGNDGAQTTKLAAASRVQEQATCTDLLKIVASLLSRCPHAVRHLLCMEQGKQALQQLLDACLNICFGSPAFGADNQFMSGFLIVSIIEHFDAPHASIHALFFPSTAVSSAALPLTISLPAPAANWVDDPKWIYSALCVFRGILTTLGGEKCLFDLDLPATPEQKQSLLGFMYDRIAAVADSATDAGTRLLAFQNLASWLGCVSNVLHSTKHQAAPDASLPDTVALVAGLVNADHVETIFVYVYNGWEDPIDSIQHKLKDILLALLDVIQVSHTQKDADARIYRMLGTLLAADWHRKVKYDLLSLLLAKVTPKQILALRPDFLSACFEVMTNVMLASRISAFINKFLKQAFAETNGQGDEMSVGANLFWLVPVCTALTSPSPVLRKICSENMIVFILKEKKDCLQLLLSALDDKETIGAAVVDSPYRVHGTIAIMKAGRLLDLVQLDVFLAKNREMVSQAISHPDDNLRIDVLSLLCETRQKTADFSIEELKALKSFLTISLDSQSPDFRQRVQAHLVKLLRRLRRAMYANWRDYLSCKNYLDEFSEHQHKPDNLIIMAAAADDHLKRLALKREFLQWMCDFAVGSLFPGCSFQRATSNLSLMSTILASQDHTAEEEHNARVSLADMPDYPTLATPETVSVLLALINNDTYAPNRDAAYDLLCQFPAPLPGFPVPEAAALLARAITAIATGIKSHQSDTGAILVRLVFEKYVKQLGLYLPVVPADETKDAQTGCPVVYFIRQLIELLKRNIDVAKRNLYCSATGYPMHGLFRTLHNVLLEVDFASVTVQKNAQVWKDLVEEILQLIGEACETVLAVCADESPEGNLPASFADMQQNMEDVIAQADIGDNDEEDEDVSRGSEAQLMLYSCFHTIKETSAVLQAILCRTPLPGSHDMANNSTGGEIVPVVTYDQIVRSGDLLRRLLASIRHRGAFSAVHVCFSSLCATLLASNKSLLVQLPETWLQGFLAQVISVDVSITRRSAGLPLGVLAIVSAPVPHRQQRTLLVHAMKHLLAIGLQPVDTEIMLQQRLDLPQVHAYNIIRAILQDASVASDTRDFVGDAFALTIAGFSSPSFPVRNCAAMLFSTCLTKALGTKKTRDEHHPVNTVTAREFFTRFPDLRPRLLAELEDAVQCLEDGRVHPALYPILTVLARLKPAGEAEMNDNDANRPMAAFRPVLARCVGTTIYKAREMSARAYAPLVPTRELVDCVERIVRSTLKMDPATSKVVGRVEQNAVHGALLQVLNLLIVHLGQTAVATADPLDAAVREDAINRLPAIFTMAKAAFCDHNPCAVTKALYLTIVTNFLVDATWVGDATLSPAFVSFRTVMATHALAALTAASTTQECFGSYMVRRAQAVLVLRSLAHTSRATKADSTALVAGLLRDDDYEVQLAALKFLERDDNRTFIDAATLKPVLADLVLSGTTYYYQVAQQAAHVLTRIGNDNSKTVSSSTTIHDPRAFVTRLLSVLEATKQKPDSAAAFMPLLGAVWNEVSQSQDLLPQILSLVSFWSHDDQPLVTRLAVVTCLGNMNYQSPTTTTTTCNEQQYANLMFVYLAMLEDDDPEVREGVAGIVCKTLWQMPQPVTAPRCRDLLGEYIARQEWKDTKVGNMVVQRFAQLLVMGGEDERGDARDQLEALFDTTASQAPAVLFAREASNSRREQLVQVRLAARCLSTMLRQQKQQQTSSLPETLVALAGTLPRILSTLNPPAAAAAAAVTAEPIGFAAVARALLATAIVATFAESEGEDRRRDREEVGKWVAAGQVHPALVTLWTNAMGEDFV
ncbi:hypothetical protein PhCBS80983_g01505 [Powellomyces hirtus]|uniref:Uncharacterized protein n=1 Tax=Powellomyces hirtus TaxID=109895 RepID=A0A507E9P1_9FUNG|nr:hypothetical protein PhCBS80983_g01505 [Powellomyces hirtus]